MANKKYIQGYDPALVKAVTFYHEYHRDSHVDLRGWFCDPTGHPVLLTRVIDERGMKESVLLMADYFHDEDKARWQCWDIGELQSCATKDEHEMVQHFMDGTGDVPEECCEDAEET